MMLSRLATVTLMIAAVAGCRAEGGGWIFSAFDAGEKATIGFLVDCEFDGSATPALVEAGVRYHDPGGRHQSGTDVAIRAEVERAAAGGQEGVCVLDPAVVADARAIVIEGRYWPVFPLAGRGGEFRLEIEDTGTPGFDGDELTIQLTGGAFDGYANQGPVNEARITYIDEEIRIR